MKQRENWVKYAWKNITEFFYELYKDFETAFKNLFSIARAILLSSLIFAPLVLLLDKFHSSTNLLWKFSVSGVYGLLALITIIYIFDNENRKKR